METIGQNMATVSTLVGLLSVFAMVVASHVSLKSKVESLAVSKKEKIDRLELQHRTDIARLEGADKDILQLINSKFEPLYGMMLKAVGELAEVKGFLKARDKD